MFPNYLVVEVQKNGTYGNIRSSKNVIFDASINFRDTTAFPSDEEFHPTSPSVALSDHSPQLPPQYLPQQKTAIPASVLPPEQAPDVIPPVRRVRQPPIFKENIDPDAVYWYLLFVETHEYPLQMVETTHFNLSVKIKDPNVHKNFWDAMRQPDWEDAINKERGKFELNNCLEEVPYTGQHLVDIQ